MSETAQRSGAVPLVAIGSGAVVAVLLGVYGAQHEPTFEDITTFGFPTLTAMKVWLAVAAGVMAVGQVFGALWLYGKLPMAPPSWLGVGHRISGFAAVALSLPVAYHCLWSLGFQDYDTRVLVHSIAGCALYGAFVFKVVGVHSKQAPRWLLPFAGSLLFTAFLVVVLTSAGWYLNEFGLPEGPAY
ncbi:MAG TPA: DUF6529 family protein [Nocardioidaceae bacterium]|nr:DUF6529 family protein [Nocardioidaceae bacterium]